MALKKITDSDLTGVGVIGMADTPNLSAREMQEKVEEVVRSVVIPVINANVDETVSKEDLADAIFAAGGGDMSTAVYDADKDGVVDRAKNADNGIYTYVHTKNGTVHNLEGREMTDNICNIRFGASADWESGDSLTINGIEARCYNTVLERQEDEVLFRQYSRVELIIAYKGTWYECFFKTGGAGIPDGETATPANQVSVWQKCAGLNTKYTTVRQILADSETMAALINSTNAMAYYIRSTDIQAETLTDSEFIAALDALLPVVSPSMQSATSPYGTVTHNGFDYNTYEAFKYPPLLTETTPSAYLGNVENAYVQYEFAAGAACPWVYKVAVASYGTRQYRIAALLEDDSMVYLTDWVDNASRLLPSVHQEIVVNPHSYRCKAVRIYTIGDAVNNYNYLKGGKIWGK